MQQRYFEYDKNFKINQELTPYVAKNEDWIRNLFALNLETIMEIRFLKTEYYMANRFGESGRVDVIGIDYDMCPAILEFKKDNKNDITSQADFYGDLLLSNKFEFIDFLNDIFPKLYPNIPVPKKEEINWDATRRICVAANFSKYEISTVRRKDELGLELISYKLLSDTQLIVDFHSFPNLKTIRSSKGIKPNGDQGNERLQDENWPGYKFYIQLIKFLEELDDNLFLEPLASYIKVKLGSQRFFAIQAMKKDLQISLNFKDKTKVDYSLGCVEDTSNKANYGQGHTTIKINSQRDLEIAKEILLLRYEEMKPVVLTM
jgi:predicted transport protein